MSNNIREQAVEVAVTAIQSEAGDFTPEAKFSVHGLTIKQAICDKIGEAKFLTALDTPGFMKFVLAEVEAKNPKISYKSYQPHDHFANRCWKFEVKSVAELRQYYEQQIADAQKTIDAAAVELAALNQTN